MSKILRYLQEKIVFLPVKLSQGYTYAFPYSFEEYLLKTPYKGLINALHFKVKNPRGVLLYFHGNADNLVRWGEIAGGFTAFDYDVFVMDYRGFGKSSGPRNEEFLYSDAQFCYDFLKREYGEKEITVFGRSLGGTFATRVAADNQPKNVILEATFYNLEDVVARWISQRAMQKISNRLAYHFESDLYIKNVEVPLYHFHGDKDLIVPINSGKKLFTTFEQAHPELPKKFIKIHGGTHDDLEKFDLFKNEISKILR